MINNNERGSLILILMVVLLLLSIVAISLTNSGITEIQISRNKFFEKKALYAAESGIEYSKAILKNKIIEQYKLGKLTGNTPEWDFIIDGSEPNLSAATSKSYKGGVSLINKSEIGNQFFYSIKLWNNDTPSENGNHINDTDGKIFIRSQSFMKNKTGRSIEVLLQVKVIDQPPNTNQFSKTKHITSTGFIGKKLFIIVNSWREIY